MDASTGPLLTGGGLWPSLPEYEPEADIPIGGSPVSTSAFLRYCITGDTSELSSTDAAQAELLRRAFLSGGRESVAAAVANDGWTQISIALPQGAAPGLYATVAKTLVEALRDAGAANGFFLHKPPGMRLRLQSHDLDTGPLAELLAATARELCAKGLAEDYWPEIYEPETALFGGPTSMAFVHRLFTVDTRFWLDQHARGTSDLEKLIAAMVLLRHLFANFGIVDWEDLGVWEKVRDRTGRAVPDRSAIATALATLGPSLVELWSDPGAAAAQLSEQTRGALDEAIGGIAALAPAWREAAFRVTRGLSPRSAAALYTIFMLNRGGLSLERQTILAEVLAARSVLD